MKKSLILIIAIAAIVASAFYVKSLSQLPDLVVNVDGMEIEVVKCALGWDWISNSFRASYPIPPEIAENMGAAIVKKGSTMKLHFSRKPKTVKVMLWDKEAKEYAIQGDRVIVPQQNGIYIFEIYAKWNLGEIMYILKLDVQ